MSSPTTFSIVFAIILLATSPMPIGLTPGFLSRGMRRHATKAVSPSGFTSVAHSLRATAAKALQRSVVGFLKEEQKRRQEYASIPEGPAAPCVWMAACLMLSPVICS